MAPLWLEFHYKDKCFDYAVYDVDVMQMLDLIGEIEEKALKQDVLIPDVFDMYFKGNNGEKVYIRSDRDLMFMFSSWEGSETISVWMEDTINPIKEFELSFELKRKQMEEEHKKKMEEDELRRLDEESIEIEPLGVEIPVVDVDSNDLTYVRIFSSQEECDEPPNEPPNEPPQNEPQAKSHSSHPNEPPQNEPQTETPQTNTNTQECPTSNRFSTQNSQQKIDKLPVRRHSNSKKKMPKSTARRKGVYVSNAKKSGMSSEGQSSHVRAKRNVKMSNEGDMDEEDEDEDVSMDDDYCFNVETDTSGDEDESTYEDEEGDEEYPISTHPFDTIFKNRGWSEDDEDNENGEDEEDNENGEDGEEDKNGEKHVTNGLCGFDKQYLDKVYKNGQMYCPQRWGEITLRPFFMFMSKADFMLVLSDFCIQQGISLIVIKSDKIRYTGQCSGEKCTWKLHCSRLPDRMTWAIKTISGDHIECFFERQNPMATTQWMAKKLEIELRAQPNMPVKCMKKYFMDHYGLEVALRTMYKVRIAVTKLVTGGHEQSYNYLGAYCEMIKKTNPGSYALITWNSPNNDNAIHFKGLFVSYNAWIRGFLKGCRPIIGVDGCHLKGRFKGVLLSAISLDGNNKIFCVAYAIVGKETTDSWTYFFRNLRIAFQQHQCIKWDWTFISDRMKGVDKAIEREFPLATIRVCAQHT